MHAHVSYLTEDCPACLIMLTVEKDIFFELSDAKGKILAVCTGLGKRVVPWLREPASRGPRESGGEIHAT